MVFDGAMHQNALRFIEFKSGMQTSLADGDFEVHYQPIVDIESNKLVSMEALVRWHHPEKGMVSPADFIPVAEETGLILPLSEWVLRTLCHQIATGHANGYKDFWVAVNLSARQFETDVPRLVRSILPESAIPPSALGLEITEGIAMKNVERNIEMLNELPERCLNISIDDFGTGYSSLAYLKRFLLNTLKIDRSFIIDIEENPDDQEITKAIIAMGQKLNLKLWRKSWKRVSSWKY